VKIHPNDDVLEELLLSLDGRHLSLLRHLSGCAFCRARTQYLPRPLRPHPMDMEGRGAIRRAWPRGAGGSHVLPAGRGG
jgi:hypothetical protein